MSCPSAFDCIAVGTDDAGGLILATTDGGTTWQSETPPSLETAVDGIACTSTLDCLAVGGGLIIETDDGGGTWTTQTAPFGVNVLSGVTCASTTDLLAVGGPADGEDVSGGGVALATKDAGASWQNQSLPSGIGTLYGITCPSESECIAVGHTDGVNPVGYVIGSTDGGSSWIRHRASPPESPGFRGRRALRHRSASPSREFLLPLR